MKNCAVAEFGFGVRAIAIVPSSFFSPALSAIPARFDWSTGLFFAHFRLEPAALNHETVDDAVKDRAIVETALGVLKKIRDRLGALSV